MTWIVGPAFTVAAVVCIVVKPMAVEEDVGDEYRTAEPIGTPAPTAPATPETEVNARSPSKSVCRIVQRRIRTPHRSAPDVSRVIGWHIDYIGIGRLNHDGRVDPLGFRGHRLLRCRRQVPIGLRGRAELLDRCHDVGLLSQKRIAQVRCPAYVLVQALQHIGKRDQCLDAGVPRLLFRCLHQLGSMQSTVPLQPLLRFHNLKGISGSDQHLREEPVRIKCNRCYQISQLVRRKNLCLRGRRLCVLQWWRLRASGKKGTH
jgi:hypothetical protein